MPILVLAEPGQADVKPATLATITAAKAIGGDIHVLVAGSNVSEAAKAASAVGGVSKVLVADSDAFAHGLPEPLAPLISQLAAGYTHVLAPATTFGKNVLPRAAAILDVAQISDAIAVVAPDTFKRPIYAANAIATVQSLDAIKLVTVRSTAFAAAAASGGGADIEPVEAPPAIGASRFVSADLAVSERPELTSARVVVSGGRGIGSGDNFKIVEALAEKLGAAVGASRAAVDAGFAANDLQVGQTGKVVAPELYIAIGISGAIQHLAGMKDSKTIVAINKDPDAPIFQVADYGLVADLFEAVPELTKALA